VNCQIATEIAEKDVFFRKQGIFAFRPYYVHCTVNNVHINNLEEERKVKVVIDNLANFFLFLQTKPSFSPLFAWSQLDISAISDSVFAVSEGYQLNYSWILKLLRGPKLFKLLNLCGNHPISIPWLLLSLFLLILGKIFLKLNLE
jgi:hypothetical protein